MASLVWVSTGEVSLFAGMGKRENEKRIFVVFLYKPRGSLLHTDGSKIITERQEASLTDHGRKKTCVINSVPNHVFLKLTKAQTSHTQLNKCRAKDTNPHFSHSQSFGFVYWTGSYSIAQPKLELSI